MNLQTLTPDDVLVPADVPSKKRSEYVKNFLNITRSTGRLALFAGDQKIEHLNDDFAGTGASADSGDPEHLFRIAAQSPMGTFASQYGLIAQYGRSYPDVLYTVKLNSKSNLVKTEQHEPLSSVLLKVEQALALEEHGDLQIAAFGYTIYLGSEYEPTMLYQASRVIHDAHTEGKLAILWIYPRGKAVPHEFDPHLLAGAAGVAVSLGADFVKINLPKNVDDPFTAMQEAVKAAGRCRVVTAGGSSKPPKEFLQQVYDVIHVAGAAGTATGRNIHQKSLPEALRMATAIAAITYENKSADEAYKIFMGA